MIILVDFENTHASGFQGVEYLDENDTLVVYYSDENSAVSKGVVDDLKEKNVHVRMVKLLKQHSNALDMYIASTTGMFLDTGEKICIVSKDKGYAAVRDFWHSLRGAEILLGETIEECFLHSVANDDPRIRRAKERSQKALLTEVFETMNNIPTRPTLSRNNFWRRRKQLNYDLSKNLSPVEILPNPLAKPELENDLAVEESRFEELRSLVQEEQLSELHEIVLAMNAEGVEPQADLDSEIVISFDNTSEQVKTEENTEENIEGSLATSGEITEAIEQKEIEREEKALSSFKEETKKTVLQKKAQNQIQFVWDPTTKSMIKVGEGPKENSTKEQKQEADLSGKKEQERDESSDTKPEIIMESTKKTQGRRRSRKNHTGVKEKAEIVKLNGEIENQQEYESSIVKGNSSKESKTKEEKTKRQKTENAKKQKAEEVDTKEKKGNAQNKKESLQKDQAEVNKALAKENMVEKKEETAKVSEEKPEKKKSVRRRNGGAKKQPVEEVK